MDLILYVHEWTTGKFDLLKYQQYMLTMCECWGGGGGGGMSHNVLCVTTRCSFIQQTAHSETMFNTAARPPQSVPQTGL